MFRSKPKLIINNLRFAGQYHDAETGLYYNLNRYYDPTTGRYLRTDPFGEGLNLYSYVFNNPLSHIDPLGLCIANPFKMGQAVFGYISEQLEQYAPTNPVLQVAATIVKTVSDLGYGISSGPETMAQQFVDWVNDPMNPNKVPVLGPLGEALGTTTAMVIEDPNLYTISQAAGAYSEALLLVAGGARAGSAIKARFNVAKKGAPCFIAGTLVETEEGLRPIEEVEVGDFVLSRDEETGEIDLREVVRVFVTPDTPILELELENEDGEIEEIGTTAEHPFWVKEKGWVFAGKLLAGNEIFTSNGGWLRVNAGTWLSERQTVYNFEVYEFHTYFVGTSGAWVHNNPCAHQGASKKKTVVFGGNMEKRVIPKAKEIDGHYYKPRKEYSLERNKRWAKDMKRQIDRGERDLKDMGPDPIRQTQSEPYLEERKIFYGEK